MYVSFELPKPGSSFHCINLKKCNKQIIIMTINVYHRLELKFIVPYRQPLLFKYKSWNIAICIINKLFLNNIIYFMENFDVHWSSVYFWNRKWRTVDFFRAESFLCEPSPLPLSISFLLSIIHLGIFLVNGQLPVSCEHNLHYSILHLRVNTHQKHVWT